MLGDVSGMLGGGGGPNERLADLSLDNIDFDWVKQ